MAKALKDISDAATDIPAFDPSQLLDRLAAFGADLTRALDQNMSNLFASGNLRLFGPMLFVEVTRALAGANSRVQPKAMLELKSLQPRHSFDLASYVSGSEPPFEQVAVSQTIVNSVV
ncbi:hypothetical protein [Terriglobus sp.]|uniref:hypothetical protein n=1 Tax=Terriglobus sp. TaxID=1889013 RepID=UPI003B007778